MKNEQRLRIVTAEGELSGQREAATWVFKGIPYAAPPIGALQPGALAAQGDGPVVLDGIEDRAGPDGSSCGSCRRSGRCNHTGRILSDPCFGASTHPRLSWIRH